MTTYGDKTLTITGTVLQASELDAYVIFGSTAVGALKMKCSFGSNSAAGIADGQTVTIQGTVTSWDEETEFIYLSNCSKK